MTTLATLQASFQRHVLGHEERFSDRIATPPAGSAEERIAIYRDAYRIRLREALASNYARLESLLGEAAFAEIADAYIEAQPSTFRSIRWFGDALPALLEAALPAKPWLAELAQWEWAIAAAFDAVDAAPLTAAHLSGLAPTDWPNLRFGFHPSVRCLRLRTNAAHLFDALAHDAEVPAPEVTSESSWLISRRGLTPRYRSMHASEARALRTLLEGGTFEEMCTTLCEAHAAREIALHAAQLLRGWIDEELVCNFVCAAQPESR